MADVAREAGVSVMTVSNVLNERLPVNEPTRARVMAAVEALGYEVNLTARHLRAGRTDTVAFIVPSFHDYFGEVADKIAPLIEADGRHLVLERTSASPEHEMAALSVARLQLYDGVLLSVAGLDRDQLDRVRTAKPIVLLGERDVPDRFNHVRLANEEGARLATAHMIEHGSRRIRCAGLHVRHRAHDDVGPPHWLGARTSRCRPRCRRTLCGARLHVHVGGRTRCPARRHRVRSALRRRLRRHRRRRARRGRGPGRERAPGAHDVQLAGFDNLDMASFVPPGLTSVDANHEGVA
jgi:DNA-binding LacI/PurR family transcriptional regulator